MIVDEPPAYVVVVATRTNSAGHLVQVAQSRDNEETAKNLPKTPEETEKYFDRMRNGFMEKFAEGKVVEERRLTVQGHPARWFRLEGPINGTLFVMETEFILVQRRVYALNSVAPRDAWHDPDFKTFLSSFQLIDAEGQPLQATK